MVNGDQEWSSVVKLARNLLILPEVPKTHFGKGGGGGNKPRGWCLLVAESVFKGQKYVYLDTYQASSAATYTSVYTDSEPGRIFWGADEELSDEGSLRVIVYGYNGLSMLSIAPPSPDYIPGFEEPHTPPALQDEDEHEPMFIQPHDLDFVPKPIYPKYIPLDDEHILPAEEQPLPTVGSPTIESPGYVVESDPEEDPEEYEDDETDDGSVDYPMDGGDNRDDDDDLEITLTIRIRMRIRRRRMST
nr:hypothetical protein [Tanacetum cinerariifolium]